MDLNILDDLEKIFTILAIIIGGLWAYFNYFKGRVYRTRIEPKVSGKVFYKDDSAYLIVSAQLKNVGLSKVNLQKKGSGFRVFKYLGGSQPPGARTVKYHRLGTFSVFNDHRWIESGETIKEEQLIRLPKSDDFAFLLEMRIVAHKISFKTKNVVPIPELVKQDNS